MSIYSTGQQSIEKGNPNVLMETRSKHRSIYAYAHWVGLKDPFYMGELRAEYTRGKEIFSFSYSDTLLNSKYSQMLDPDLQLFSGSQYAMVDRADFGLFLDKC